MNPQTGHPWPADPASIPSAMSLLLIPGWVVLGVLVAGVFGLLVTTGRRSRS